VRVLFESFVAQVTVQKLLSTHFGRVLPRSLYVSSAFAVQCGVGASSDGETAVHSDQSVLTVNICLERSRDANGGQLIFSKPPGSPGAAASAPTMCTLLPGEALIHYGALPHAVSPMRKVRHMCG
jgi:hypothetical protein